MNRATCFFFPFSLYRPWEGRVARCLASTLCLLLPALSAQANTPEQASIHQQMAACARQSDASVRLACYDALAAQLVGSRQNPAPSSSTASAPINEENALFKLSCAYFAKDC